MGRRHVGQRLGLGGVEGHGLLDQHVLAGLDRLNRERHVQVVRRRDVDRVDLGVGQHRLVRPVHPGNAELRGRNLGTDQVARGDPDEGRVPALLHAGNDFDETDIGGADDAPADF